MRDGSAPVTLRFPFWRHSWTRHVVKAVPTNHPPGLTDDQQKATESPHCVIRHGRRRDGQTEEARLAWGATFI
jgi:hypothetical protein